MSRHEGAKVRTAKRQRVSKPKQVRAPREGSPDWQLALIDERHVQTLVSARKVGLPLVMAAEMAGISPELAQTWLTYGRQLNSLGKKDATTVYGRQCRAFAQEWDTAVVGLIAVMRGYMVQHAKKDPKACAQALASFEREYTQRRRRIQSLPDYTEHVAQVGQDLAEPFAPLELTAQAQRPPNQSARFTHTNPDGSHTAVELTAGRSGLDDEMDGRTEEELDFYAQHGSWPHEQPIRPIDTEGEDVSEYEPEGEVEEEIARLQGVGKAEGATNTRDVAPNPIQPPAGPQRPFTGPIQQAPALALPPAPARPLRRRESPEEGLLELTDPIVPVAQAPKAPKVPTFAPLPRVDPDAAR